MLYVYDISYIYDKYDNIPQWGQCYFSPSLRGLRSFTQRGL
jgi:hypothetical protein